MYNLNLIKYNIIKSMENPRFSLIYFKNTRSINNTIRPIDFKLVSSFILYYSYKSNQLININIGYYLNIIAIFIIE